MSVTALNGTTSLIMEVFGNQVTVQDPEFTKLIWFRGWFNRACKDTEFQKDDAEMEVHDYSGNVNVISVVDNSSFDPFNTDFKKDKLNSKCLVINIRGN